MICFDITDLDSFRNVDNWFEEIKRYCPEQTPIFLVGTKSDLQSKRMIPYSTIKAYVEKKNLSYVETSSKNNENIELCFLNFSQTLVQHTNTLEATHKKPQPQTPNVDLSGRTKPIRDGSNSGCFGGNSCTI